MYLNCIILKAGAFYMTKKGHNFPRVKGSGSQSAVLGPEAQDQDHWEMCQT